MADLFNAFFTEFPPGALAIWLGILTYMGAKMWGQISKVKADSELLEQAHTKLEERIGRGFERNDDRHGFIEGQIAAVGKHVLAVGSKVDKLTGAVDKMNGGS